MNCHMLYFPPISCNDGRMLCFSHLIPQTATTALVVVQISRWRQGAEGPRGRVGATPCGTVGQTLGLPMIASSNQPSTAHGSRIHVLVCTYIPASFTSTALTLITQYFAPKNPCSATRGDTSRLSAKWPLCSSLACGGLSADSLGSLWHFQRRALSPSLPARRLKRNPFQDTLQRGTTLSGLDRSFKIATKLLVNWDSESPRPCG